MTITSIILLVISAFLQFVAVLFAAAFGLRAEARGRPDIGCTWFLTVSVVASACAWLVALLAFQ